MFHGARNVDALFSGDLTQAFGKIVTRFANQRLSRQQCELFVKSLEEPECRGWIVSGDEVRDLNQVNFRPEMVAQ